MDELAFALGSPRATARIRSTPEDFQVDEVLGFEPDNDGDHAFLQIRKRGTNTEWLARELAKFAGVKPVDDGYSGLKDRHAVTSQWFSINLARKSEPDWAQLNSDSENVLHVTRNRRKLKRGAHAANQFILVLREIKDDAGDIERRVAIVRDLGVPNYFGEQRFGRDAQNVARAREWFAGGQSVRDRHERGMILSAARSYLFNRVLSRRVADGSWNQPLPGEAFILDGTHSFFVSDAIDDALRERISRFDIHPSGPMWGKGEIPARGAARALEENTLSDEAALCAGLENAGLRQERRALRLRVEALQSERLCDDALKLSFVLEPGSYATTVLREFVSAT